MECERATVLLSGMLDSALGPIARFRMHRHVAGCNACATRLEELRAMQSVIRTKLPYHRAPPGLAARIGAALPHEEPPRAVRPWFRMPAFSLAGTGLVGALAGVALTVLVMGGQSDPSIGVIDSHIRSLQADHLTDVLTSDQHTVKPWLSARLDVSPPVLELKDAGFPLVGGRQDYVDGHPTAVVVYRHAKHVINLFAWASSGQDEAFREETRQGFNVITWRHGGIRYYAVSDVEADQLAEFAKLVAQG
ncbi:MAG: anti-sigma factor [Acetobacteraceae bacterium]|jgi:anti-sigma factor RsiW